MSNFESTDRYKAMGIPYPDPKTMCGGDCEGTGVVPLHKEDNDPKYAGLWLEAEKKKASDDCYHMVKCPDCKGTGKETKETKQ